MKLVEILARELVRWPKMEKWLTQDPSGRISGFRYDKPRIGGRFPYWFSDAGGTTYETLDIVASDHSTAIITRADWEAERERIKGEQAMPRANKDGWIRHRGGKCPVAIGDRIDVRYRNGNVKVRTADADDEANEVWMHVNDDDDIMAWRPHKPEPQIEPAVIANVAAFNDRAEMPAAKYFDGPLQWRDRITEINRQMAELRAEKADLVGKLREE